MNPEQRLIFEALAVILRSLAGANHNRAECEIVARRIGTMMRADAAATQERLYGNRKWSPCPNCPAPNDCRRTQEQLDLDSGGACYGGMS